MVIIRRHGATKLDNKPCRTCHASVNAFKRLEKSSDSGKRGTSRLDPYTLRLDAPHCQHFTSHIPYVQCIDAPDPVTVSTSYDVTSRPVTSVDIDSALPLNESTDFTDPLGNTLSPEPICHLDRPISSAFDSVTSPKLSPVTSHTSPHSPGLFPFTFIYGFKELRVVVIYLIFSMFLICKGCVCSVCSGNSSQRNDLPWYLNVQLNQSKVGYPSDHGTCLTMTGSYVDTICNKSTSERMFMLNSTNTNFCGLPTYRVLSAKQQSIVSRCAKKKCTSVLRNVERSDNLMRQQFCLFKQVLDRMDCREVYSYAGTCAKCEAAYRSWLCSIYVKHYFDDEPIKPCIEYCDRVSENCPFFRPYGETQIGEPGFLCKGPNIKHHHAAALYGPPGCCFQPKHMCHADNCTTLHVTSNCTVARSNSAPGLRPPHPTGQLYIYLCIFILWASQALSQYSCIGLT